MRRPGLEKDGCRCTYDKGEPASSLGSQQGWRVGGGSADVGEGCGWNERGQWVNPTED